MMTIVLSRDEAQSASTGTAVDWRELLAMALSSPGRLGNTYCRFYSYSFANQLLLWSQGVTEPCAPFSVWKALGRIPVKGGGRAVMHPRPIVKRDEETGEKKTVAMRFIIKRSTFPYSATRGEEVAWPELPAWDWRRAITALDVEQVPFAMIDGNTQGWSQGRTFAISPVAAYPMKTLFHELAHIVLGHTTATGAEVRPCSRGLLEFQAEAVAYLVAHEVELCDWSPEESRAYIQHWLDGQDVGERDIRQVLTAAEKIISAGRNVSAEVGAETGETAVG